MSEEALNPAANPLTFDRVVTASDVPEAPVDASVVCAGCQAAIDTEYYDINGHSFCGACRQQVEAAAAIPRGVRRFLRAAAFGVGAAFAGAAIYYAVIAITGYEIGLVAILIGYMVGYAVRKGARGGSLRYQILAVTLTYGAVGLAYTPMAIQAALEQSSSAEGTNAPAAADADESASTPPSAGSVLIAFAFVAGMIVILPVLVATSNVMGLISALIIFFGLHQAWKMTGRPALHMQGPYRVGPAPLPASV
jgi:hypothetical protein